jgi:hypothetical protein
MHQSFNNEKDLETQISIRSKVLKRLGKPVDLFRVDVIKLWEKTYRINVWRVTDSDEGIARKYTVSDSFFGKLSSSGALKTNPKIEKKY